MVILNIVAAVLAICALSDGGLLKAATVASAQSTQFKHPVLDRWNKPDADGKKGTPEESVQIKELMALTDNQVRALIPDQPPTISDLCPVCTRKNSPGPIMESVKQFPVEFDPLKPDQIKCRKCGTVFPNADFPLKTIGDYIGHRSPDSTQVYSKVAIEALRQVALGDGEEVL